MKNTSYLTNIIDFGARRSPHSATGDKPEKGNKRCSYGSPSNASGNGIAPLLTTQDACAYLQCSPRFLQKMVRSGRLRALKPSRKLIRYRLSDIDHFVDAGKTMLGVMGRGSAWGLAKWGSVGITPLLAAKEHCSKGACNQYRPLTRIVTYPPPSTGTNYNLVEKVEHDRGDRVTWCVIHSPEGSFTYDYSIKAAHRRRKRCRGRPECHNFLEPGQRKCIECQLKTRKDRNRRHYQVLKARIKTVSPRR